MVALDQADDEVGSRRHARRCPNRAVSDVDTVLLDLAVRKPILQHLRIAPVRRGAPTVQQSELPVDLSRPPASVRAAYRQGFGILEYGIVAGQNNIQVGLSSDSYRTIKTGGALLELNCEMVEYTLTSLTAYRFFTRNVYVTLGGTRSYFRRVRAIEQ